jgi:hypothetical protein
VRNKVSDLQSKLSHAAKQSLDRKFGVLYDTIYREDVVWEAWRRVMANKGAPGVDKQDLEYTEDVIGVEQFLIFWIFLTDFALGEVPMTRSV